MLPRMRATCASPSSWVSLPLVTSLAAAPSVTSRAFCEAGVDEALVDVLEDHWDVGGGDHLRDLAAHHAGADDGGLEDEHALTLAADLVLQLHIPAPLAGEAGEACAAAMR